MKKTIIFGSLLFFIVAIAIQKYGRNDTCHKHLPNNDKVISEKKTDNKDNIPNTVVADSRHKERQYKEISHPTPNIDKSRINTVEGVILHHTAEPTIERSLEILTSLKKKVGTHCVIDTDGTRYIMCEPDVVTYHAGYSLLNGKEGCNYFTIGIEFQGNTLMTPLTEDQINSAIEYLKPLIKKYKIPFDNIVTHEMIRQAYKKKYPRKRCSGKVDITQTEYKRFMISLKKAYENK